jgi:hypothetical protein
MGVFPFVVRDDLPCLLTYLLDYDILLASQGSIPGPTAQL